MNVAFRRTCRAVLIKPSELGPDESHPRVPHELQKPVLDPGRRVDVLLRAGRDDEQRLRPYGCRLGGEIQDGIALDREDHQIGGGLELAQSPYGPSARHDGPRRVNQFDHAAEAAARDVLDQRAPDASRPVGGRDDRDRCRSEDRSQRGKRGEVVALVDPLHHRRGRGDVNRDVELLEPRTLDREAGIPKHAEHRTVRRHHRGIEAAHGALRPDRRQLFEHSRADPTPLFVVGHRERDLGDARFAQPLVAARRDHTPVVTCDQRYAVDTAGLHGRSRDDVRAAHAVEAEVPALRGESRS